MARRVPRTRAGGRWTEARFSSFIKSALRAATYRWAPISDAKRDARVERGVYRCEGYERKAHRVPASVMKGGKRVNNVFADHIVPVVNPADGFTTWDDYINRMFCEQDNLQVLCRECHDKKTADERKAR